MSTAEFSKQEVDNLLNLYLEKILEKNKDINLTTITDLERARLLHLEDSLAGLQDIKDAPEGLYADLGSGGGFPGIPLAVASGRKVLLIDSVQKKMKAVKEIAIEIGLSDLVDVYSGRVETLSIEKPGSFSVITARALSHQSSLLELAAPLLRIGGQLISYKSQNQKEEINKSVADKLGFKLIKSHDLVLSDGETSRTILVYEKIKEPSIKLPRKMGIAQKRPLK